MSLRALLAGLIVLATLGFVVGTTIERHSSQSRHESAATVKAEGEPGNRDGEATHAGRHAELKPLGIDIEAAPFVALAAAVSLALALAAWHRPRFAALLLGVCAAMLVFALLDVREVFHQADESRVGLAVLAAAIAATHAGAAVVAGMMAARARL